MLKQGHGPAGRPVATRIYRDNGKEVLNVHELKTDDSIWLSFGEDFKQPYSKCCGYFVLGDGCATFTCF